MLLDHRGAPQMIPVCQKFFDLTDHTIEKLKSLRNENFRREILLGRAGRFQKMWIDVGPHATAAFSSWSDEKAKIKELTKKGGIRYAINQYVDDQINAAV
jgi:hypothetical protein